MRQILIVMILSVLIACVAVGGTARESIVTQDEFAAMIESLSDLMERATYLAITGFSAYDSEDQKVVAQELVNLFEGSDGPNYESQTADVTLDDELGILASFESLINANASDWFEGSPYSQYPVFRDLSWSTEHFLRLSYVSALEAQRIAYSLIGPKDAFRTLYAFLLAARGGFDDPFLVAGVQNLRDLLPSPEDRAFQDESIQAAIDALPDGGTLQLESGIYREPVIITKSVTIVGATQSDRDSGSESGTVLEGVAWEPVISVLSDESVTIVIENLTIRGGGAAIHLWLSPSQPNVTLDLKNVTFLENGTGLALGKGSRVTCTDCNFENNELAIRALAPDEGAQASFTNCVFDGNKSAIEAWGTQIITLESCLIQNGTDPSGDISLAGAGMLEMRDSELLRVAGKGIVLADTASMTLVNNVIETSYSYAIAVASTDASLGDRSKQNCEVFLGRNDSELPLGTITGYGNTITGGVCPVTLLFLTDLAPAELTVSPGESIQAAIDHIADGGVITLEPGEYREALTIGKSVRLMASSEASADQPDGVTFRGEMGDTLISIESSDVIEVEIRGISIRGGSMGIDAKESVSVRLDEMTFSELGTGLHVTYGAIVRANHCAFSDSASAVRAYWSGVCELSDCVIERCSTPEAISAVQAAISVSCSELTLERCIIRANQGSGIRLGGGEASRLHMTDCDLSENEIGLELIYGGCNPGDPDWEGTPRSQYRYGSITGWNNLFSGFDSPDDDSTMNGIVYGLGHNSIDLAFLSEPKPGS